MWENIGKLGKLFLSIDCFVFRSILVIHAAHMPIILPSNWFKLTHSPMFQIFSHTVDHKG